MHLSAHPDFMTLAIKMNTEMIYTCLGWSWCHTLGHCVHRESLTRWPSSRPWSSPARRLTLCRSDSSLERERERKKKRGKKDSCYSKSEQHQARLSWTIIHCTCCRLDFAELFWCDTPHAHCRVCKASCNQAGVICEVHCSQTLQEGKGVRIIRNYSTAVYN